MPMLASTGRFRISSKRCLLWKQDVWLQQLQHKLQAVTELPPAAMLELYQVLEKCSLPQSIVESCIEVLDGKALGNEKAGSSRLQQKPQQCDSLVKYLTAEEIGNLETQDMWSGTAILAKRLRLLGVRSMKESTKKAVPHVSKSSLESILKYVDKHGLPERLDAKAMRDANRALLADAGASFVEFCSRQANMSGRATAIALESKKNQHLEAALVFTVMDAHKRYRCEDFIDNANYFLQTLRVSGKAQVWVDFR
eukprot:s1600_g16.t1